MYSYWKSKELKRKLNWNCGLWMVYAKALEFESFCLKPLVYKNRNAWWIARLYLSLWWNRNWMVNLLQVFFIIKNFLVTTTWKVVSKNIINKFMYKSTTIQVFTIKNKSRSFSNRDELTLTWLVPNII